MVAILRNIYIEKYFTDRWINFIFRITDIFLESAENKSSKVENKSLNFLKDKK